MQVTQARSVNIEGLLSIDGGGSGLSHQVNPLIRVERVRIRLLQISPIIIVIVPQTININHLLVCCGLRLCSRWLGRQLVFLGRSVIEVVIGSTGVKFLLLHGSMSRRLLLLISIGVTNTLVLLIHKPIKLLLLLKLFLLEHAHGLWMQIDEVVVVLD
jgi:hypothetical protein